MDNKSKNTEQLILDAAIKEFSTKGFDGARTSTIAAEAGVTHAMLHYYFRTKEKLFEQIFRLKIGSIMNMVLSPIIESKSDIKQRIARGVETHFDFVLANRELPQFVISTINSRPDLFEGVMQEIKQTAGERYTALQAELDKAHANGEIAQIDVMTLLSDIVTLNIFPFLAGPIFSVFGENNNPDEYLQQRKKENVELILRRIS